MAEWKKIEFKLAGLTVEASLDVSGPGKDLFESLPISGSVNTWGDEIYFNISETLNVTDTVNVVQMGDIAYWAPGNALCIFFFVHCLIFSLLYSPDSDSTIKSRQRRKKEILPLSFLTPTQVFIISDIDL